jgi:predicted ATPase/DNA-binding SARP family transcriptional activator
MRLEVLGPLRLLMGEADRTPGSTTQRRLLAALAVRHGRVVSTDRLCADLWGDELPPSALASLRTYVYRLRSRLAADAERFETRSPGYVLHLDVDQFDAAAFERTLDDAASTSSPAERLSGLDEALDLWRGPAYAEVADEPFARAEAQRLDELRLGATEDRAEVLLEMQRHAEAASTLTALVADHPLRERPRVQLALAHYRSGRLADALTECRQFARTMRDELGLDPPERIARLERQILHQAPDLQPAVTAGSPPTTPPAAARDLPTEPSVLLGRDDDLARLRRRLSSDRVVCLTGVGGVGKTRLALRAAHAAAADGEVVVWCELAGLEDGSEVAPAVAVAAGIQAGTTGPQPLAEALAARRMLLVLDNAEHVVGGVAELVRVVTTRSPAVRILATSRLALGLPSERVEVIAPLPATGAEPTRTPAMELFLAHARAIRPDLHLGTSELDDLAKVCRRLDGVPLALELAASRLRTLNPHDLAARLGDRFRLLVDDRRPDARHRGLREVVDWSLGLLSRLELRLFTRLSVFAGSFTLDAAEAVGADDALPPDEVVDLLGGLVDHNLVAHAASRGPTRYVLLETLREAGRERLEHAGEAERVRSRHASYYVGLVEALEPMIRSEEEAAAVARLDRELDDLRAVHRWAVSRQDVDTSLRLHAGLFRYTLWRLRTELFEQAAVAASLPGADAHPCFPVVAGMAGWGAGLRGDHAAAEDWAARGLAVAGRSARALAPMEVRLHLALWNGRLEECLQLAAEARSLPLPRDELVPYYVPGLALTYAGRADEALEWLRDVRTAAERHGSPSMRSVVSYTIGEALLVAAPEQAAAPLEEATELAASVDDRMLLGVTAVSLASLQARRGEPAGALRSFVTVLDRLSRVGDWTHLWTGLRWLVVLLTRLEHDRQAAILLGAVTGAPTAPSVYGDDAERLSEVETTLRARLGEEELRDAMARGAGLVDEAIVHVARDAIARAGRPATAEADDDSRRRRGIGPP